jgi:hypothetical protein
MIDKLYFELQNTYFSIPLLRALRKFAKSDFYLCRVCPSVRMELDDFSLNLIFEYLPKMCLAYSGFIKIGQEEQFLHMKSTSVYISDNWPFSSS